MDELQNYENIYTLGDAQYINGAKTVWLRIGYSPDEFDAAPGLKFCVFNHEGYVAKFMPNLNFAATDNGISFTNKIINDTDLENSIRKECTTCPKNPRLAYYVFLPDLAIPVSDMNETYAQNFATQIYNSTNTFIAECVKHILTSEPDINKVLEAVYLDVSWLKQPSDNSYIPYVRIKVYWIGPNGNVDYILTESERVIYKVKSADVIKCDSIDRWYFTKQPWYWEHTMNIYISDSDDLKSVDYDLTDDDTLGDRKEGVSTVTNIKAIEYNGKYSVPSDANDFWTRTLCFWTHNTVWGANGMPKPINEKYCKYLEPNVYAYTQPVWKFPNDLGESAKVTEWKDMFRKGLYDNYSTTCDNIAYYVTNEIFQKWYSYNHDKDAGPYPEGYWGNQAGWNDLMIDFTTTKKLPGTWTSWAQASYIPLYGYFSLNFCGNTKLTDDGMVAYCDDYKDSYVAKNGYLPVRAAWFTTEGGYFEYNPAFTYCKATVDSKTYDGTLMCYTVLPNGQGHNPDNGITLGWENTWCYNYPNGNEVIGLRACNSATHSAICFTNVSRDMNVAGAQTRVEAYTDGDELEPTIINGITPTISLSIKGQNIGRMNLETNNVLVRW